MALCSMLNSLRFQKNTLVPLQYAIQSNHYAKANMGMGALGKGKKGKAGPMIEKKLLPVETDVKKLVSFVCGSNIYKEGQDVELKPDSEYPEWLWKVRIGPAPKLEELDPETKEYWKKIRKMALQRNNQLARLKKF